MTNKKTVIELFIKLKIDSFRDNFINSTQDILGFILRQNGAQSFS